MKIFDVIVIGSGPGGYTAALEAARLNLATLIIESGQLGGVCLNTGCIPSKTLIYEAGEYALLRKKFPASLPEAALLFPEILSRTQAKAAALCSGVESLLSRAGVEIVYGKAAFTSPKSVIINDETEYSAENIIIATGTSPVMPDILPSGARILNSESVWHLPELPSSIAIMGGGVIGCELASALADLGVKVTVFEMAEEILPGVDHELVRALKRAFEAKSIQLLTSSAIDTVELTASGVKLTSGGQDYFADYLLSAVGRKPNSGGLNLEAAGVECDRRGFIKIDEFCRTTAPNIYAIGDITGKMLLAHTASAMGKSAVRNITGSGKEFSTDGIPAVIFTHPELASVGLTENAAKAQNIHYNTGRFPFAALGRAVAEDAPDGMVKIIAEEDSGRILGAHIAGKNAGELIAAMTLAVKKGLTAAEVGETIQAHPTYGEALSECADAVDNRSLALPLRRKKMQK